jgi:hypothetical protein
MPTRPLLPRGDRSGAMDTQVQALCIDGPYAGHYYALYTTPPIVWLGSRLHQPYRPVQEEGTDIWYYVYADAIDDDPPITIRR